MKGAEAEAIRDAGEHLAVDRFGLAGAVPRGLVEKVEDRLAERSGVFGERVERLRCRRNAWGPWIAASEASHQHDRQVIVLAQAPVDGQEFGRKHRATSYAVFCLKKKN